MSYLYFLFFILLFILLLSIFIYFNKSKVEGFGYPWRWFNFIPVPINNLINNSSYCPECGKLSKYTCGECVNCGYCISHGGYGECVLGDAKGPYFREDCIYYEHGTIMDYINPFAYNHMYPTVSYPRLRHFNRNKRLGSNKKRRNSRRHSKNSGI